ncbi:hypothetical protein J4E70_10050 [Pseudohalocynthiibacter aestuariivivens]|uniref:hypothetical protein n=1 Tax=Pseudohalocynthiibacter aestuariivivens TaxID=1591409 RepID=UPI001BD4D7DF|nr:hypothetical protein [Pseudohalocynthiibacter aestuariivivens]MBS9717286.1 hypothetical protein [Pseudohalocynthiibacter aestuariivivens]
MVRRREFAAVQLRSDGRVVRKAVIGANGSERQARAHLGSVEFALRAHAAPFSLHQRKCLRCSEEDNAAIQVKRSKIEKGNNRVAEQKVSSLRPGSNSAFR